MAKSPKKKPRTRRPVVRKPKPKQTRTLVYRSSLGTALIRG